MIKPALRLPVWATIFTVIGIAILITLGMWQLHRLEWKENLLSQIAAAQDSEPLGAATLVDSRQDTRYLYHPAAIYGLYDSAKSFLIGPRTHNGEAGYHLIVPLQILEDNRPAYTLLVNRGWVAARPTDLPEGFITVTGMLRTAEPAGAFVPPNNPAADEWYSLDIAQLTATKGLQNVLPYILYATGENPADPAMSVAGAYHAPGGPMLANNHRQYAGFWFAMAAVLVVIYILRFLRPAKA